MPLWPDIALLVLLACSAVMLFYWMVVAGELAYSALRLKTARDGLALPEAAPGGGSPAIAVVIPAHNERAVIATVATSLAAQDYPNFAVVFSLDRCTDGTREALAAAVGDDPRFAVHEVTDCPADWVGKVHAVWSVMRREPPLPQVERAELLVFADADTIFDPACLRACQALLRAEGLDLLSLMSTLTTGTWFEKIVQPVAGMEMLTQFPPRKANRPERRRALANGQFMMWRREAYWSVRGHFHARQELLEDLRLAKIARDQGLRAAFVMAQGMLHCRMYRSWETFERGWRRIYGELAQRRAGRLRGHAARLAAFSILLPLAALAGFAIAAGVLWEGAAGGLAVATCIVAGAALVVWLGTLLAGHLWGRSPWWGMLLHIPAAALVVRILLRAGADAASGRPVSWGGRSYAPGESPPESEVTRREIARAAAGG